MRDLETTARIRREDLTNLLELGRAPAKQRTTAEMPAVTLTNLLCIEDEVPLAPPPAEMPPVVVKFRTTAQQAATTWPLDRWPSALARGLVIALSASATLVIARLITLL